MGESFLSHILVSTSSFVGADEVLIKSLSAGGVLQWGHEGLVGKKNAFKNCIVIFNWFALM